jgi:hypothetical protein
MISTASGEAIVFGGRIRSRAGNGIVGAKIEILSRNTRTVLASSISIEGGSYRIRVLRGAIDSKERALTIRALSGSGKLLVTRSTSVLADETVTDLVVPAERLKNFRPAAQFLRRITGSIMDPECLTNIESTIRLIIPEGGVAHERLARVIRRAMPLLARFDSVLQDSWDVLEGSLDAAQRLRRALTFFANAGRADSGRSSAPPRAREGEFGMRDLAYRAIPTTPLPDIDVIPFGPPVCPAPTTRLVPIMAAALRIATDADDAAVLLDGLDTGLRGLNSFESLTKLSDAALSSGNTASLVDELLRLEAESGLDADSGLGDGFGLPFPPPWPPPPQTFQPCGRWVRECFGNLAEDWRLQAGIRELGLERAYRITSVTRSDACPEEQVVIAGNGFGGIPGQVVFPHRDGKSEIRVDPIPGTWTNTSVSAEVPAEAGSGILRLLIQDGLYELVWTCEGPLAVYAQGNGIAFDGGATFVSSVTINGRATGAVVAPGSQFTVAWKASPASQMVEVDVTETSTNMSLSAGLRRANDTLTLPAPSLTSRGQIRAIVFAQVPPIDRPPTCGQGHSSQAVADIDVAPNLKIEGVEVTQGIQVFSLQGARNTLITVANKDTIVRVYVAADTGGTFSSPVTGVTGVIRIDGTVLFPINGITPTSPSGGNPFITARAAADINRAETDHTLNFRIPAALANHRKTLDIRVWGPGPPSTRLFASTSMAWQWVVIPPLTVRFVLIEDPLVSTGAPSESQARYTLQRALDLLPTPATNIAPAWYAHHTLSNTASMNGQLALEVLGLHRRKPDPATGTRDDSGWIGLTLGPIPGPGFGASLGLVSMAPIYINQGRRQGSFRIIAAHEITHWLLGGCHTDDSRSPCAGSTASNPVGQVIFDPYWNEAVSSTLSYFKNSESPFESYWIRPADWDRLSATIIAWEGRP